MESLQREPIIHKVEINVFVRQKGGGAVDTVMLDDQAQKLGYLGLGLAGGFLYLQRRRPRYRLYRTVCTNSGKQFQAHLDAAQYKAGSCQNPPH